MAVITVGGSQTAIQGTLWSVPSKIAPLPETVHSYITLVSHTLPILSLHNTISTFPAVRILSRSHHSSKCLPLLPEFIFVDVHYFSFQLLWLLGENLKLTDIILRMLVGIKIAELSCNQWRVRERLRTTRRGYLWNGSSHPNEELPGAHPTKCVCIHGKTKAWVTRSPYSNSV